MEPSTWLELRKAYPHKTACRPHRRSRFNSSGNNLILTKRALKRPGGEKETSWAGRTEDSLCAAAHGDVGDSPRFC
jgi:hypothetical protein